MSCPLPVALTLCTVQRQAGWVSLCVLICGYRDKLPSVQQQTELEQGSFTKCSTCTGRDCPSHSLSPPVTTHSTRSSLDKAVASWHGGFSNNVPLLQIGLEVVFLRTSTRDRPSWTPSSARRSPRISMKTTIHAHRTIHTDPTHPIAAMTDHRITPDHHKAAFPQGTPSRPPRTEAIIHTK